LNKLECVELKKWLDLLHLFVAEAKRLEALGSEHSMTDEKLAVLNAQVRFHRPQLFIFLKCET